VIAAYELKYPTRSAIILILSLYLNPLFLNSSSKIAANKDGIAIDINIIAQVKLASIDSLAIKAINATPKKPAIVVAEYLIDIGAILLCIYHLTALLSRARSA